MRIKFRYKVFLTLIVNSLVIVICMLLFGRYYAHRNFEEYVSKVEMERLDELAEVLSKIYRKDQNWDSVLKNWDEWLKVISMPSGPPPRQNIGGEPSLGAPPPMPPPSIGGHPGKGERPRFGELPPPPGPPPESIAPRMGLFDVDKRPVTGIESTSVEDYRLGPILVDGLPVGWLGLKKRDRLTHPLDLAFIRQQSQTFYTVGGVALLLASVVTVGLSRHILSPVRELAEGARALTSRRFQTRIGIGSRDEFGQLATDFNAMAQALEHYEQMRRQWMADISHELRTPLAILRGEIEAMQDGVREPTREALESLHFEVLHLSRIVHELHDLSLMESKAFEGKQTALNPLEVLKDILGSFHTLCEQHGIRIEADIDETSHVTIMADADRLKQLYSNLVENTLRYANAPGVLRISHERLSDRVLLRFEDSGPGVPEESLGRLFDRLYRVDKARSRARGGSGLGLSICKSIVESFGGWIEASNAPSAGLRISIGFPVRTG